MREREDLRDAELALRRFDINADKLLNAINQRKNILSVHGQSFNLNPAHGAGCEAQIALVAAREKLDLIISGLEREILPVRLWLIKCPYSLSPWLRYAKCMSVGEIARGLGVSRWTVRRESLIGLKALAERLEAGC